MAEVIGLPLVAAATPVLKELSPLQFVRTTQSPMALSGILYSAKHFVTDNTLLCGCRFKPAGKPCSYVSLLPPQ